MKPILKIKTNQVVEANKKIIYLGVLLSVFVYLLFTALSFWQYKNERKSDELMAKVRSASVINFYQTQFNSHLEVLSGDVKFISHAPVFKDYLKQPSELNRKKVEDLFTQFALQRKVYDQIRYLDKNGQEIIRINYNQGQATVVPVSDLQNKKGRYYFDETLLLNEGGIYTSPIDLNIENNKIEEPYKPMLRIGTPAFLNEEKVGVVILNYLAKNILDESSLDDKDVLDSFSNQVEILDSNGYWLKSSLPRSWGMMFSDKKEQNLIKENPKLWDLLKGNQQGQVFFENGFYSFATLESDSGGVTWKIYNHIHNNDLYSRSNIIALRLILTNLLFAGILVIFIWYFYRIFRRLKDETQKKQDNEQMFKAFMQATKDAVVVMDDKNKIVFWNQGAVKMFGYDNQEIVGQDFYKITSNEKQKNILNFKQFSNIDMPDKIIELSTKRKNGEIFIVELSMSKALVDERWRVISIMREITERKKKEKNTQVELLENKETAEKLTRMNQLMVDRELAMVKLKQEIVELKQKVKL